jgi:hypothetical protein
VPPSGLVSSEGAWTEEESEELNATAGAQEQGAWKVVMNPRWGSDTGIGRESHRSYRTIGS